MPDFAVSVTFNGMAVIKAKSKADAERKAESMNPREFDNFEPVEVQAQRVF